MGRADSDVSLRDEAARAGWLYYVGGLTQDQIAAELGVSRQRAQRLVSRATADGLIHVRLEHKIGACLNLEAGLTRRFGLSLCRVAPGLGEAADVNRAIAATAAAVFESFLRRAEPLIIALGTGRALRAMIDELTPTEAEQHKIVSLIGNIAPDGSASYFDVIMRIADKVRAPHYPMPVPVISDTAEERELFHRLRPVRNVFALAQSADVTFVGVGQMGDDAPLLKDGFLAVGQLREAQARGAAGEVAGWVFDSRGQYIDAGISDRVGGVRVEPGRLAPVIGIAAGANKLPAIRAALSGRIINGLVTDEPTAAALLAAG
ncbi:MAG: sugar-binding transcriptional regulator [Paracoccaceae bacterium]